jgi:hypothetical protein
LPGLVTFGAKVVDGEDAGMKATFVKGVALGAAVAMVTLVGSAAVAGTGVGKVFNLGEDNRVNARSQLEGATPSAVLSVTNSDKSSAASGVAIDVPGNDPPLVVNSATKVKNLNADLLDGHHASEFQSATSKACPKNTAISAIAPNGATTCNASVVIPINDTVGPNASGDLLTYLPTSLGINVTCPSGLASIAIADVLNLGPAPVTINYDSMNHDETNGTVTPNAGHVNLATNAELAFGGQDLTVAQIEFLDPTAVTTVNLSIFDNGSDGCEFQGTIEMALR